MSESMPEIKPDASPPELRFKIDRRLFPFESRFVSLRNGAHIHNTLSDKPTLIVWGLEDFAFQEPERMRFEKAFPNHRAVLLKGAGHFIQEDKPDEISSAIRNWYPNGT
jgi:pimeloyl-ACP methyl ester carboxylesterase